ncbi:MAG TPA: autotransporter domain-containing protein, partial [Rhizomicrobium sp.]|nr:autotransporter domain-containing protein [Rhizomicrobium sp.]
QVAATANGSAMDAANIWATATGLRVQASSKTGYSRVYFSGSHSRYETTVYHDAGGTVGGTIDNSGSLLVSASAPGGEASAYGIKITANANSVDIANHSGGRIGADATGATAVAVGIFEGGEWSAARYHYLSHFGTTAKNYVETYQGQHTNAQGAATAVTGDITNSGTISVSATASGANIGDGSGGGIAALSLSAAPHARAEGIRVNAMTMSGAIQNSGAIDVTASGSGAIANGIHVLASRTGTASGYTEIYKYRGTASGYQWTTVSVSTPFHTAVLEGSKFSGKVSNSGTISVSAKGGGAKATGVLIEDEEFDGSFRNTGTIAAVATGTDASAVGVEIDVSTLGSHASFVNDGGTISALTNGAYGTAIDVSGAPSSLVLALNGGRITGNIVENAAGNAITIGSGNLVLDGLVNPSKAKLGSLTVGSHGTLTLANDTRGNGTAYVNSFVQNGTLAITGAQNGASGSIHAGSATLSGAAIVNLDLSSGTPYDTSTVYKVVFSDSALSGTWSTVSASAATTFFSAAGQYSANEADIVLSRATFDSIAGLTSNEQSVAHAIETIYEGGTTGTITDLLNAILNLSPAQYPEALDALSGESAGELSAVDQSSAQNFLDLITSHLGDPSTGGDTTASLLSGSSVLAANVAPTDVSPAQLSDLSGTKAWGGGFQYGSSVDATASGPGYSSHQSGILAGVDVPLSRNALFGIAASYGTGDIKTDKLLGFGTFSAAQFAGYGRFMADNGLYGMGEVSYGSFTNKLNRYVSIPGFGSGMLHGKFDSTAWGLYGEAGWRFEMDAARVTPYAAISYLDADSDGYTEAGSFPVPLTVKGSTSKATSSYLGLKLATDWQLAPATITPRLTAAWQHDYTKNAWEMSAAFTAVPTVGFGLNGSDLSRDFAYVDGGFTLHISNEVDVLLDYQGRFSSDRSDNAFLARANVRF